MRGTRVKFTKRNLLSLKQNRNAVRVFGRLCFEQIANRFIFGVLLICLVEVACESFEFRVRRQSKGRDFLIRISNDFIEHVFKMFNETFNGAGFKQICVVFKLSK